MSLMDKAKAVLRDRQPDYSNREGNDLGIVQEGTDMEFVVADSLEGWRRQVEQQTLGK